MKCNILTTLQSEVLGLISKRHKNNPITGGQLTSILKVIDNKITKGANMRAIINSLRDKGYPICANTSGYFLPTNTIELRDYILEFQSRIDEQQKACNQLKNSYNDWIDSDNGTDAVSLDQKGLGI